MYKTVTCDGVAGIFSLPQRVSVTSTTVGQLYTSDTYEDFKIHFVTLIFLISFQNKDKEG